MLGGLAAATSQGVANIAGDGGVAFAQSSSFEKTRPLSAADGKAIAEIANGFLRTHGVPGLSVAVARQGQIVYAQGFGLADPATGEEVTPDKLFRIASISKPFTAVALFALIEKGRLHLDDKVFGAGGILGFDFGTRPYRRYVEDITVEHLLTHTAGGWQNDGADPMFSNFAMNHAQLVSWTLDNVPLKNAPGTSYAYSNFGFCLLGRVIEKATHQYYATMMRDLVFHPAGITQMRIAGNTPALRAPAEVAYGGPDGQPYGINVTRMDAHGGWIASASDLVRFAVAVDGIYAPPLLRPASVEAMTTPSRLNPNYAKGWSITGRNWWHNGSLPGTSSIMVRTPGGLCWAALANGRNAKTDSVGGIDRMMWDIVKAAKGFGG
jgi:CubicO group peptidase (beta-lactamase class C family)